MQEYRLYNEDVAEGITNLDDQHFIILLIDVINENTNYALILNRKNSDTPYIVVYNLEKHEHESIDWEHGRYFGTLLEGINFFMEEIAPFEKPFVTIHE